MKPEEFNAVIDWIEEHGLEIMLYIWVSVMSSGMVGGIIDMETTNEPYWVAAGFAVPPLLPFVAWRLNRVIYRLRTRGERKQLKTEARLANLARLERELFEDV